MAEQRGWIRLHRQVRDNFLWPTHRRYSNLEAWLDLLLSANHKAASVNLDYKVFKLQRGEFITSKLGLSKRWSWHRETVDKFLRMLETDEMIVIETSNKTSTGYTKITICNCSKYQDVEANGSNNQARIEPDNEAATERQPSGTNKNEKNSKNENKKDPPPAGPSKVKDNQLKGLPALIPTIYKTNGELFKKVNAWLNQQVCRGAEIEDVNETLRRFDSRSSDARDPWAYLNGTLVEVQKTNAVKEHERRHQAQKREGFGRANKVLQEIGFADLKNLVG